MPSGVPFSQTAIQAALKFCDSSNYNSANMLFVKGTHNAGKEFYLRAIEKTLRKNNPTVRIAHLPGSDFMEAFIDAICKGWRYQAGCSNTELPHYRHIEDWTSTDLLIIDEIEPGHFGSRAEEEALKQTLHVFTENDKKAVVTTTFSEAAFGFDERTTLFDIGLVVEL